MRIAFLTGAFPAVSETFVLNQIVGLLDFGHDVHIFADKSQKNVIHGNYEKYGLSKRTHYYGIPKNKLVRIIKALLLILKYAPSHYNVLFRSLNVFRYGKPSWSLSLLFISMALLERGPFDIIYCQFGTIGPSAVLLRTYLKMVDSMNTRTYNCHHAPPAR